MKRFSLFILWLLCITAILHAHQIQRVVFNHTLDNFKIQYHDSIVQVFSYLLCSDAPPHAPAIPVFGYTVEIPKGMKCIGYRIEVPDTVVVCHDKVLAKNPGIVVYNEPTIKNKTIEAYSGLHGIFPEEKIVCNDMGFLFYPFEYNSDTRELTFTPTIIIDRILVSEDNVQDDLPIDLSDNQGDTLVSLIYYHGNDDFQLDGLRLDSNYDHLW